jgi:hypothetical protein
MLNLFILIILNDFEQYNLNDDNPVEDFKKNLTSFKSTWEIYTTEYMGLKMHERFLLLFLQDLKPPLGNYKYYIKIV